MQSLNDLAKGELRSAEELDPRLALIFITVDKPFQGAIMRDLGYLFLRPVKLFHRHVHGAFNEIDRRAATGLGARTFGDWFRSNLCVTLA